MSHLISRREFSKTTLLLAAGAMSSTILAKNITGDSPAKNISTSNLCASRRRYRAVSWWLTWDDLSWPNPQLKEKILRRADQCAASAVNCCLIFGAHFRWDFMPLWDRLHDELRFIADELHQRNILLFDHHSSVLTHRPRSEGERLEIWRRNRHHVPFYPSSEEAARWSCNGSKLNDWRMIDVETGAPIFLSSYNAEQFCMNHPDFRAAYAQYLKRMRVETGVDGLMSDDGIYYADWRACGCVHCRQRFKKDYGHELPSTKDTRFWGNLHNEAFKDWIAMRFQSSGDFLAAAGNVLPKDFPLLTCCCNSDGYAAPAYGMSYEDFIHSCNHVLLEMVGSTPTISGTWNNRIASQLLHLGIAREHNAPCLGLGYGFFPDTAFFIWAVNKFLGSDTWFSTLKGRLNASPAEAALADDAELVGECFRWEKSHEHLFVGEVNTPIAMFFSRATRDFFGQTPRDYSEDYSIACQHLMDAGVSSQVTTEIPKNEPIECLVLNSAICLSPSQRKQLRRFVEFGGTIVATGPLGFCNERAKDVKIPWLEEFGLKSTLTEPLRPGNFPPYDNLTSPIAIARCELVQPSAPRDANGWIQLKAGKGEVLWRPERMTEPGVADALTKLLQKKYVSSLEISGLPANWRTREFRDGNRILVHALPRKVETRLHATLKNQVSKEGIVEKLVFTPLRGKLTLQTTEDFRHVNLYSPDLQEVRVGLSNNKRSWQINLYHVSRYFVLECVG